MKYEAVIWDMDGTILDTLSDLMDSINYMLRAGGYEERTYEEIRLAVGNGVRHLVGRSLPGGEENPRFPELFEMFQEHYKNNCRNKTLPYEGIGETLDSLKKMGLKMAVVSNKVNDAVLELTELYFPQMDYALGDSEGLRRKPAPDMVEKAINELGVEKDKAVYIGDSEVDLMTAKNAGLDCINVLWGFRRKEELLPFGADVFAEKPEDIVKILA